MFRDKKEIVVMKFGGTSVGDADKIRRVASRIIAAKKDDKHVVVAVSAMGDTTDRLIELASQVTDDVAIKALTDSDLSAVLQRIAEQAAHRYKHLTKRWK